MTTERHLYSRMLVVLAVTTMPLLLFLLILQHWYFERKELADNVSSQAAVVSTMAGAAIAFNDEGTAREILAALSAVPMVIDAGLFRTDGSLLAGYATHHPQFDVADLRSQGRHEVSFSLSDLQVELPVVESGRTLGFVVIRASQEMLYKELMMFFVGFVAVAFLAGLIGLAATGSLRRRLADYQVDLQTSNAKLQQLISHRDQIIEAEHKRIAVEIHDELGQVLTAALLQLRLIEKGLGSGNETLAQPLKDIESLLNDAYLGMKNIATSLFPSVITFGLRPALEWLAERLLTPACITWRIDSPEPLAQLTQAQSVALFRIVQEALTNVVRHAAAHSVTISLVAQGHGLVLEICDDGVGFTHSADSFGFGLPGIRERTDALRGTAEIVSEAGKGTCIRVTLPSVGES